MTVKGINKCRVLHHETSQRDFSKTLAANQLGDQWEEEEEGREGGGGEEGWVLKITIVMLLAIIVSKLYVSINLTSESLELLTFMLRLAASFNVLMNPLSVMTVM